MNRRQFIRKTTESLAIAGAIIEGISESLARETDSHNLRRIPKRKLAKLEGKVSVIGLGASALNGLELSEAKDAVAIAMDRGVNYFDSAPVYSHGEAEEKLGAALGSRRSEAFLSSKTLHRLREPAMEDLSGSLLRLKTNRIDLYLLHNLSRMEDLETVLSADGALRAIIQAKDEGRIRSIGFSSHSEDVALAALDHYPFDAVMFPVNFILFSSGFGPRIMKKAKEKGAGILAIKPTALRCQSGEIEGSRSRSWYQSVKDESDAALALRFALSQPVVSALPSGDLRSLEIAMKAASALSPLNRREKERLAMLARDEEPIFRRTIARD